MSLTGFEKNRLPRSHVHNSKTHFSLSNDSCTHKPTFQAGIDVKCFPGCFCRLVSEAWVRRPRVVHECSGRLKMAPYIPSISRQMAGIHHTNGWWVWPWIYNLAALCDMWKWKWHQWMSTRPRDKFILKTFLRENTRVFGIFTLFSFSLRTLDLALWSYLFERPYQGCHQ